MPTPLESYNKRVKKREKEKRRKARLEVRNDKKLLEEPEKLKKELDELTHKAIIGRIDQESIEKKEKIEKLWEQYTRTKKLKESKESEELIEKSEKDSSSDESDYSSDSEDSPKCVIEILGQPKKETKKEPEKRKRGFHDPDPPNELPLEVSSHVPKLEQKKEDENEDKDKQEPKNFNYTPRPTVKQSKSPYTFHKPPPPPPVAPPPMVQMKMNVRTQPPQPPPMMMGFKPQYTSPQQTQQPDKPSGSELREKVPLSKYFVPSQVRLNRKNLQKEDTR